MEVKFTIPEDLEEDLKSLSKLKISLLLRRLVEAELLRLSKIKQSISKSQLTEKDVIELSNETDRALAKRFKESLKR